jgi:hypothetical protein
VLFLILATGTVAVAQQQKASLTGGDGDDDEAECPECPTGEEDCCDARQKPIGRVDLVTAGDCSPGNVPALMGCIGDVLLESQYDPDVYPDGFEVLDPDQNTPSCIGFKESLAEIGTIKLSLPASGRVAKIYKLIEAPHGETETNPEAFVRIALNLDVFQVNTEYGQTAGELNAQLQAQIAEEYVMTSGVDGGGHYWIVVRDRTTYAGIVTAVLRADDEGIVSSEIELRPKRVDGDYSVPCGQEGF